MGTSKVVIRKTAKRKDGSSKGTIKTRSSVSVSGDKATAKKTRKVIPSVNYIQGS